MLNTCSPAAVLVPFFFGFFFLFLFFHFNTCSSASRSRVHTQWPCEQMKNGETPDGGKNHLTAAIFTRLNKSGPGHPFFINTICKVHMSRVLCTWSWTETCHCAAPSSSQMTSSLCREQSVQAHMTGMMHSWLFGDNKAAIHVVLLCTYFSDGPLANDSLSLNDLRAATIIQVMEHFGHFGFSAQWDCCYFKVSFTKARSRKWTGNQKYKHYTMLLFCVSMICWHIAINFELKHQWEYS